MICHQLCLVDHSDIIIFIKIRHFYGRCHNTASFFLQTFLSGTHRTRHFIFFHLLIHFQCEQTKRSQINTISGQLQTFQGTIGFSAVGRSYVQNKMPVHLTYLREFHLRSGWHQLKDLPLYHMLSIFWIQCEQRLLTDGSRMILLQPGKKYLIHPFLLFFQKNSKIQ